MGDKEPTGDATPQDGVRTGHTMDGRPLLPAGGLAYEPSHDSACELHEAATCGCHSRVLARRGALLREHLAAGIVHVMHPPVRMGRVPDVIQYAGGTEVRIEGNRLTTGALDDYLLTGRAAVAMPGGVVTIDGYHPAPFRDNWLSAVAALGQATRSAADMEDAMQRVGVVAGDASHQMRMLGMAWVDEYPLWARGVYDDLTEHPRRSAMHAAYRAKTRRRNRRRR